MIELSVHLITYNNENQIEDTLQSILKQKVDFNYEIVVGDDCSTDDTYKIIKEYAAKYPQIFNIKKNDLQLGILKNFKTTLDRCHGTFVFDIAGDDMLKTDDALQKMVNVLRRDANLGFVYSGFDRLDDNTTKIEVFQNKKIVSVPKSTFKKEVLLGKVNPMTLCYNKAFLYKYVDFEKYLEMGFTIEDYPIFIDLIMNTDFAIIKESLHIYRIHNNSFTHQKNLENHLLFKKEIKKIFNYFSNKYNYPEDIIKEYSKNHNKELLFLAGYFENKMLGKEIFKNINSKSPKDYIHYFASQNHYFRLLLSKIKKLTNVR